MHSKVIMAKKFTFTLFSFLAACDEGCTRELMSDMDELEAKLDNLPFDLTDPNITAPFAKLRRIEEDAKNLKVIANYRQTSISRIPREWGKHFEFSEVRDSKL